MIDISQITALISAFRVETEKESISPETVGKLLQDITDLLENASSDAERTILDNWKASLDNLSFVTNITQSGVEQSAVSKNIAVTKVNFGDGTTQNIVLNISPATNEYAGVMTAAQVRTLAALQSAVNTVSAQMETLATLQGNVTNIGNQIADNLKKDLYTAFGATWNSSTQRWALNGLTDITDEQMDEIFVETHDFRISQMWDGRFRGTKVRTNLFPYKPKNGTVVWSANISKLYTSAVGMFAYADFETIVLTQDLASMNNGIAFAPRLTDTRDMFNNAKKLKKVFGVICMDAITDANNVSGMFTRADLLEEISISGLRVNLSFAACPNLKPATVTFICNNCNKLVNNAYPSLTITLTLHATALDAVANNSDARAAIANAANNRNAEVIVTDGDREIM